MATPVPGKKEVDKALQKLVKSIKKINNQKTLKNGDLKTLKELAREAGALAGEANYTTIEKLQQAMGGMKSNGN